MYLCRCNEKSTKTIIGISGGVILLALLSFFTFGRHSKVVEGLKQQTASLMKKSTSQTSTWTWRRHSPI